MKKLLIPLLFLALLFPPAAPAMAGDTRPGLPAEDAAPTEAPAAPPAQWQELFPPISPSPRASHAMAYDTGRGVAVVFGGADSGGNELGDTWEWDSATMTWSQRFPAHSPSPRYGAAMAYDAARDVTVLFGGTTGLFFYDDTWLWDGNDWTQVFPATSPPARWLPGVAYDTQRQVMVLFGGLGEGFTPDDTWEWDGTNWTEQAISGPSARSGSGMAYDPLRSVTVLFGGSSGGFLQDTWERAGDGPWQGVVPPRHPSRRSRMGMTYFPQLRRVVLFGGSKFVHYDDTWFWDGQNWRTRLFDPRPSARCCTGMVYDPVLRGVLLFGGSANFVPVNDTWIFR